MEGIAVIFVEYERSEEGFFSLGLKVGEFCKEMWQKALPRDRTVQKLLERFRSEEEFREDVMGFDEFLKAECAFIRAEMKGLADGAGVEYEVVLVSVYRKELGCTDVIFRSAESQGFLGWGHNEDYSWSQEFKPLLLLETKEKISNFRWMSVVYPFCLAGMTFGVNSAGVAFSVDNLTPEISHSRSSKKGLASNVVCRLALEAKSVEDFVRIVTDRRLVTGRGFAFGDWRSPEIAHMGYIETGPGGSSSRVEVDKGGFYGHANHYVEMNIPQEIGPSSRSRQDRLKEIFRVMKKDEMNKDFLREILSDEFHEYPIYRTGKSPDRGYTEFSAIFDIRECSLELFLAKPIIDRAPWRAINLHASRWTS